MQLAGSLGDTNKHAARGVFFILADPNIKSAARGAVRFEAIQLRSDRQRDNISATDRVLLKNRADGRDAADTTNFS